MICSGICLVRFMLMSLTQSGQLRTLVHPGPFSGDHTIWVSVTRPNKPAATAWSKKTDVNRGHLHRVNP